MKITLRTAAVLFITFLTATAFAQQSEYYDFGFARKNDIPVRENGTTLSTPWAGGMNSVRFSEIDLDLDGTPDLVGFEKHGNRLLTFLRTGNTLAYAPEYATSFPKLHDWVILKDFNHDDKADIFTYGLGGIRVFENTSENKLTFNEIINPLMAYYYNGYVNLYASPDDYLVVDDVDNDGKVDILNFYVLGKYVHFLKNYANPNDVSPFDLRLEDECWGSFSEAADNNTITLHSHCNDRDDAPLRHTGSSMLLHDFSGNGLPDLLLGDVDSPRLILLYNNGSEEHADMTAQDTAFPTANPILLYSMPAPSIVSLPGQDHPSLIVSPSDPSLTKSKDLHSVWRYDYNESVGQYVLTETDFLQGGMIDVGSGAQPVLFDYDGDGLLDLFIGNYGRFDSATHTNGFLNSHFSSSISHYKNTGTVNEPAFTLQTNDFGNLKNLNLKALHPTFGDFTGNGLNDMLCGSSEGNLVLVPHLRLGGGDAEVIENYADIDVGEFSTPQLFDIDNDGKADLLVGNRRGRIAYFRNIGSNFPEFQKMTDTLGSVDARDVNSSYFGYSVPFFYRDAANSTFLFCGTESGNILLYKNIDNNLDGVFDLADQNLVENIGDEIFGFKEGKRTAVAVADLNSDTRPDLIIGNYAGGLAYFEGCTPPVHSACKTIIPTATHILPNPNNGNFTIESDILIKNVEIFDMSGRLVFRKDNIGDYLTHISVKNMNDGVYFIRINNIVTLKTIICKKNQ